MNQTKSRLLALAALQLTVGCGQGPSSGTHDIRSQFQSKISLGRSVHFAQGQESTTMGLTQETFKVERDIETGDVTRFVFDTSASRASSPENFLNDSDQVLSEYASELRVRTNELSLLKNAPMNIDDRVAYVHFKRSLRDMEVQNAFLDVIFMKQQDQTWHLAEIANNTLGQRDPLEETTAIHPADIIDQIFADQRTEVQPQEKDLYFPVKLLSGKIEIHPAKTFEVKLPDAEESYFITVSKANGQILESYSPKLSATSQVQTAAFPRSYLDKPQNFSLPDAQVTIGGKMVRTNLIGEMDLPPKTSANIRLYSDRVDTMRNLQTVKYDVTLEAGKPFAIADEISKHSTNAFLAIHRINQFVRRHLQDTETSILSLQINLSIDVPGSCNSFYTHTTVNLYDSGSGCATMANVNDVTYHEWGHGLDDYTGRQGGITDGAFSEAIGDINAAMMTGSSNMATGFYQDKADGIRQLDNTKKYPDDLVDEVHTDGLIIGGAFWDLRKALMIRYGDTKGAYMAEELFYKHLLTTDSYKESYQTVLRLDNTSGNPAAQSPNFCLITEAFAKHGLAQTQAGCVDKFDTSKAEPSIALGVVSSAADSTTYMISSAVGANAFLCFDTRDSCVAGTSTQVYPTKLNGSIGSKLAYVTDKVPALKATQSIVVLMKDNAGKLVGERAFKIMPR